MTSSESELEYFILDEIKNPNHLISCVDKTQQQITEGLIHRLLSMVDVGKPVPENVRYRFNRMKLYLSQKKLLDLLAKNE